MVRIGVASVLVGLVLILVVAGCGNRSAGEAQGPRAAERLNSISLAFAAKDESGGRPADIPGRAEPRYATKSVSAKPERDTSAGPNRKIVYTANVDLVVEDFSDMPQRVADLVAKFEGYVADSTLAGKTGDGRRASWKIRVPVAQFEALVAEAEQLGELVTANTTSQDVSEEYYDVDARIRNKTKEEERLLNLLEERPGKLEDVIAVERELSRVREELERMQGRMRLLADMTAMTSVQLSIAEIRGYEPPQAATFGTRVGRAFEGSVVALQTAGEGLAIAAVALVPWLPVLGGLLAIGYFAARALIRMVRARVWLARG